MEEVVYVSLSAILDEAGLLHKELAENLDGTVDGTNKAFTTSHKPLVDANFDDNLDASDVVAYVDGVVAAVAKVDARSGTITLQQAPAVDSTVTADYCFTNIHHRVVWESRDEAQTHINEVMSTLESTPYANYPGTPPTIRKITRWLAAGMLLTRDYGSASGTDETSKSGSARMKMAEGWLTKYLDMGGLTGGNTNPFADADIMKAPDVFKTRGGHERLDGGVTTPVDDRFFRGDDDGLGGSNGSDWL